MRAVRQYKMRRACLVWVVSECLRVQAEQLMESWAKSLHATGDDERARYVVQRLREFRNPIGDEFLAGCAQPAEKPFQCEMPTRSSNWREMR